MCEAQSPSMAPFGDGASTEVIQVERGHKGVHTVKTTKHHWSLVAVGWLLLKQMLSLVPTAMVVAGCRQGVSAWWYSPGHGSPLWGLQGDAIGQGSCLWLGCLVT